MVSGLKKLDVGFLTSVSTGRIPAPPTNSGLEVWDHGRFAPLLP